MDYQRKTRCQQFIANYQELEAKNPGTEPDEIFSLALDSVKKAAPSEEQAVQAGDSPLAASFKNAFSEKRQKINISEIIKD
jgi:hypothetical protein